MPSVQIAAPANGCSYRRRRLAESVFWCWSVSRSSVVLEPSGGVTVWMIRELSSTCSSPRRRRAWSRRSCSTPGPRPDCRQSRSGLRRPAELGARPKIQRLEDWSCSLRLPCTADTTTDVAGDKSSFPPTRGVLVDALSKLRRKSSGSKLRVRSPGWFRAAGTRLAGSDCRSPGPGRTRVDLMLELSLARNPSVSK